MVLKKSKFGGNTGNTLRKSNKGGYKTCVTAAFISKESYDMKSDFVEKDPTKPREWIKNGIHSKKKKTSLNSTQNVQFSLNKHKKWLLPEKLKCEIVEEFQKDKTIESMSKKSYKRKELAHNARVAILEKASNWGQRDFVTENYDRESRDSMTSKSFINSVDEGSNRKSKCWMGPIDIPLDVEDSMDITYTIETSIGSKTWPYHSGRSEGKPWYDSYKSKSSHSKNKKKYQRREFDSFKDIECYDDHVYNDTDDEEENEIFKSYYHEDISLDMFIKAKINKTKGNCSNNTVELPKNVGDDGKTYYEKGSYIVINKPRGLSEIRNVIEKEIEVSEVEVEDTVPLPPYIFGQSNSDIYKEVKCKVRTDEISSEYLIKRFGKLYVEGISIPRRFIIFNENFDPDGIIISVRILTVGLQLCTINLVIMNIFKGLLHYVDELFQQPIFDFLFFINLCFPFETNVIKIFNTAIDKTSGKTAIDKTSGKTAIDKTFGKTAIDKTFGKTAIEKAFKPNADVIKMNKICQDIFTGKLNHGNIYTNIYQAVCSICYSSDTLTCMDECQHYACDVCWRMYIHTKLSSGRYNILCPQTACKQKVDMVTIVTFLEYKMVARFIKRCCELHIQQTCSIKFCPSGDCPMVAVCEIKDSLEKFGNSSQLEKSGISVIANIPCVRCHCNFSWCFNCEMSDHWPSSCFANETYQLQKKKDYNLIFDNNGKLNETEVLYRLCPKCKTPVMKYGGCDQMSCACGSEFCWNCLHDYYDGHDYEACLHTFENDVSITFSSLDIFAGSSMKQRMERKAIQFSSHEKKVSALKRKLKLNKIVCNLQYIDHQSNRVIVTTSKAIALLVSGYKLLENLSAATAVCRSSTTAGHILRFIDMLSFLLGLLYTSVDVNHLNKIKVSSVMKNIELVESSLNNLSFIGIEKIF